MGLSFVVGHLLKDVSGRKPSHPEQKFVGGTKTADEEDLEPSTKVHSQNEDQVPRPTALCVAGLWPHPPNQVVPSAPLCEGLMSNQGKS